MLAACEKNAILIFVGVRHPFGNFLAIDKACEGHLGVTSPFGLSTKDKRWKLFPRPPHPLHQLSRDAFVSCSLTLPPPEFDTKSAFGATPQGDSL